MKKKLALLFFIIGIILISINISGFFIPLRSPDVYHQLTRYGTNQSITLTEQQVWDIVKNTSMDRKQYLINVNSAINNGVAYYWGTKPCIIDGHPDQCLDYERIDKFLRVPIYENYILYGMSYILPQHFLRYFFTDYQIGLERGVGFCDQQTVVLDGLLKSKGIESKMIATPHHFFETALADPATNEWWVLDPTFGVVIPYSIEQIQANPELIRYTFLKGGYSNETIDQQLIQSVFQNHTIKIHPDISEYSTKFYPFERLSYILIWVIPFCLMLPFIIKTVSIFTTLKCQ
jgi:hypothetical protein